MDEIKFNECIKALNEYEGVEEVFLLNAGGDVVFKSKNFPFTNEESKQFFKAWKEKEPSINYQNNRFAILKNDDIQLAAKNLAGGKGNIAGSITKDGDYLVVHTSPETGLILLEWSILVNKVAWS